jgi:tetratricopeptide (TPR) repeat protein
VDARSDLYALGCLLHEMLTGEEPFRAPTALGVLRRQVDDPPVPLRQLRPEVPAALEALVLDLLAKPPAARPVDAQQVFERLRPLLPAAEPGPARPYGPVPDPTVPYRHPQHPLPGAAASQPVLPPPVRPAVPVGDLAAACGEVSDLLAAQRYAEVIDLAARLLPQARAEQGDHAPLVTTLRTIYARTLLQEGQYRAALPEYQLLAVAAVAEHGARSLPALEHRRRTAACLEQLGRVAEALADYRALLADCEARLAEGADTDPARCFELRERIGLLLAGSGDPDGAWEWLLALLFDREPRLGPHHPEVLRLRRHLDQLQQHRTGPLPPLDPRTGSWWRPGPIS